MLQIKIYIYSDESGVLDKTHNDYYIFGGIIFLSDEDRDTYSRKYLSTEKNIRLSEKISKNTEVKACNISNKSKIKLYKSLSNVEKFGIVIFQKKLNSQLFQDKKTKQRYLDWAYKMAVKSKFQELIKNGDINPSEVDELVFLVDERSTATNGRYELRESLEKEFKTGTFNGDWMIFHPPIFPNLKAVNLQYCNSAKKTLVRSADIVANRIFYLARTNNGLIPVENKLHIITHP